MYIPVSRHKQFVQVQEKRHCKAETSAGVSQAPPAPQHWASCLHSQTTTQRFSCSTVLLRCTEPAPAALFSTQTPFPMLGPPVRTQPFAKCTFFFFFFDSGFILGSTKRSYT